MDVILQEDIPAVGKAGEVVRVAGGYARNYLFPRGKAVVADPGNLRQLEHQKRQAIARQAKLREAAEAQAHTLSAARVRVQRAAGPEGKLFGSVTALDIAEGLRAQGLTIDRRQLQLPEPIKQVGDHVVAVRLTADVTASVTVVVEAQ